MQLYDSFGPNPRAMRMFLAEKGITIPSKPVDLMKAENRRPPYTDRNPGGQLPALELDNGEASQLAHIRLDRALEFLMGDKLL